MKKSERIQVVVGLAKRKEDSAAEICDNAKKVLEMEKLRLADLEDYYRDYESSFSRKTQGLRATDLINSRSFLNQLSDARENQKHNIARFEADFGEKKREWLRCYMKRQSLEELVERYQKQESVLADKKEQKMIDDWVNQTLKS